MSVTVDTALAKWDARLGKVKPRKGSNLRGGTGKRKVYDGPSARAKLTRTVSRAPEVMVKITGGGRNTAQIKGHMLYITRRGTLAMEDEQGDRWLVREEVGDVLKGRAMTGTGIPATGEKRREAHHVMFSMPFGTDRDSVTSAVRAFAAKGFEKHQYVFVTHDDQAHPHVHVVVKATGRDGVRLNPRKADLQRWREGFAEALNEQGIEANATPRYLRGQVRKHEKQAIAQIDQAYRAGKRDAPAKMTAKAWKEAEQEVTTGKSRENPAQDKIIAARKRVIEGYRDVAKALAGGGAEDRKLALEVVDLVRTMPGLETQHDERVNQLRETGRAPSQAKEQGRER